MTKKLHGSTIKMLRRAIQIEQALKANAESGKQLPLYKLAELDLGLNRVTLYRIIRKYEDNKGLLNRLPEYEGMTLEEIREKEGLIDGDIISAYSYEAYKERTPRIPRNVKTA